MAVSTMQGWALDLGTTNTAIARWDDAKGQPRLVELPGICRHPDAQDPLEAPRLVPSSVHLLEPRGWADRVGAWPAVERLMFVGQRALIGRQAIEKNSGLQARSFVPTFKPGLMGDPMRPLALLGSHPVTAREAAFAFVRELLAEVKRTTGERIRDLTVTAPVAAFETYRAEVQQILKRLGVRRVRFVDEPVAAALGYGLNLGHERLVLVVDVGGGTMHVVLARLSPRGETVVLAKRGRPFGGNAVDGWVLQEMCAQLGTDAATLEGEDDESRFWRRAMLAEACRVKEAVFFEESALFLMSAPPAGAPRRGRERATLTREGLVALLTEHGFYRALTASLEEVLEQARLEAGAIEEVLLVGGSTLLPGVFSFFEERFGRQRVRAWQPFEAVAHGAAAFAAERMNTLDFIVHDYAFVTHDPKTGSAQHTVIIPRGTRFPTAPDLWKRQLVPTCSLGEPETIFKLLICEVSRDHGSERRFVWDASGDLHKVGGAGGESAVVVPLNEASPTLGYLDPPHSPRDRRPRLEVAFGVNGERWLTATVRDLVAQKELMREEPVVRLV
jgi:molecular chaperone DnaK (HSP70)